MTVMKENYRISGWLFVFICSVAVVWLSGCCHHSRKEGRIMGRHSARSRVTDCCVSTTGTLIAHFRVTLSLSIKARPGAQPFICDFNLHTMKSHFHMKRWAPRLALRKRLKVIRKWSVIITYMALLLFTV